MDDRPLPDADDYPDQELLRAHVRHPDAPDLIRRSSLVVGSKGSGKSFLLKYQQLKNYPNGFLIKVPAHLSGVAIDMGIGGKSETFEPEQRAQIQGKAAALLVATTLKLAARGPLDIPLPMNILNGFVPGLRWTGDATIEASSDAKTMINGTRVDTWNSGPSLDQLQDFASQLKELLGELPVFLLDRAEDTSSPALDVLMRLMDQSISAITLIAARPALSQLVSNNVDGSMQPGDHYELLHLGVSPYSDEWASFAKEAVSSYFRLVGDTRSVEGQEWAINLARDSLKWAIRFTTIGLETEGNMKRRLELLNRDRDLLFTRADTFLKIYNSDVGKLLKTVRGRGANHGEHLDTGRQIAVQVEIEGMPTRFSMFAEHDRSERMIQAGLRAETFSLPAGIAWHPYEVPSSVELNPLLAWDGRNTSWIQ